MALIGGARWTRYFFLVICCKKVISTRWPAGTETFSPWSYQNHKHPLVGNSQLCLNVSLIKRKKKKASETLPGFPFTALEQGQAGTPESPSQRGRMSLVTWPENSWLETPYKYKKPLPPQEFLCTAQPSPTRKASEGTNRYLKDVAFITHVVELRGSQTKGSEKETLEKVAKIERNVPPPLQFHLNYWQDHHEDPGDLKGKQPLSVASLPSHLKKSFHTASESSKSPKVTAIRIDVGNFTHQLNLLVPNMEAQWLCLAASEGIWGFEIWHVKDKKHLIIWRN